MGRTACTEPQCLYKGALYLFTYCSINVFYSLDSTNVLVSFSSIYFSDILISFAVLKQGDVNSFLRLADSPLINKPSDYYVSKLCWRNL